jgi:hypothetical protein
LRATLNTAFYDYSKNTVHSAATYIFIDERKLKRAKAKAN